MRRIWKSTLRTFSYNVGKRKSLQSIAGRWRGNAAILTYHRVLPDNIFSSDLGPNRDLAVSEHRFEEQIAFLSDCFTVIPIDELVPHLESGSTKFKVVVTFDDGWKDNLYHALPILEKYGVPATIYITTRFPEGDCGMWWFELWERIIEADDLDIEYGAYKRRWILQDNKGRLECFFDLRDFLLGQTIADQMNALVVLCGSSTRKQYPELCLNWTEIQKLNRHPLITIGAHGHSHENLRQLDAQEACLEILRSKELLEQRLNGNIQHFAYPFGGEKEASVREHELARECGFSTAVMAQPMPIKINEWWSLPRFGMENIHTPDVMQGRLSGWESLVKLSIRFFS